LPAPLRRGEQRDGFAEIRQQLKQLAEKSDARVLVVQGSTSSATTGAGDIVWEGKLGYVNLRTGVSSVTVDLSSPTPVTIADDP